MDEISFVELFALPFLLQSPSSNISFLVNILFSICFLKLQQSKRVVHLHFALEGKESIRKILCEFSKPETFTEIFYDTIDFQLMNANIWLKQVKERFSLKTFIKDMEFGLEYREQFFSSLEETLDQLNVKDVKQFVIFQVTRYKRSYGDIVVKFDITQFSEEDIYFSGTIESEGITSNALQELTWLTKLQFPVRSKVIEYLSTYHYNIYKKLKTKNIIMDIDYISSYEINHFTSVQHLLEDKRQIKSEEQPKEREEINRYFKLLKITSKEGREDHENIAISSSCSLLQYLKVYYEHRKKLNLI